MQPAAVQLGAFGWLPHTCLLKAHAVLLIYAGKAVTADGWCSHRCIPPDSSSMSGWHMQLKAAAARTKAEGPRPQRTAVPSSTNMS